MMNGPLSANRSKGSLFIEAGIRSIMAYRACEMAPQYHPVTSNMVSVKKLELPF